MAPHATNEHVILCRTSGHSSAASLTNAVLRALLRQRSAGTLDAILPQAPDAPVATFDTLPRKYGILVNESLALRLPPQGCAEHF